MNVAAKVNGAVIGWMVIMEQIGSLSQAFNASSKTGRGNGTDSDYHLVTEAHKLARSLFMQGRRNYNRVKRTSLEAINTFLDLVDIMNEEMTKELKNTIHKFYRVKYLHDFTNNVIPMKDIIDITEHCLNAPIEKIAQVRMQFHDVINNFEDIRTFENVDKCDEQLPDEVATTHCILHQAVLFNKSQGTLVTIVEMKTRQYVAEINTTLFNVQSCFSDLVPNFFNQMLVDAYRNDCIFLKVINTCASELSIDRGEPKSIFSRKWSTLVQALRGK